jgi:tRNA G18 (ribose-2'-O)-methylase SpoU
VDEAVSEPLRRQVAGPAELAAALDAREPVRLVLHAREPKDAAVLPLVERARAAGAAVHVASAQSLWRLGKCSRPPELMAVVGPDPHAPAEEVLAGGGAVWLLVGIAYPGNTGFAIRLGEVSGAAGVFVDAGFQHAGKREALRASMRADRFFPVFWQGAAEAVALAKRAGRRVVAIEDVGAAAPWQADLTGRVLLIVGGERHGIPRELLALCDEVLRIPMRGFIPSYNLQAAMAMVAGERLRQLGVTNETPRAD